MRNSSYFSLVAIALAVLSACHDDAADDQPPKIYFASSGNYEIAPGDTLSLEPRILYDNNSQYLWTDNEGNVLSTDRDLTFTTQSMKDYKLKFSVENPAGADTFNISISVQLCATFSDLDNFTTSKSSVLALQPDTLPGAFLWRNIQFANAINADTSMWYGFAFSNRVSLQTTLTSSSIGTAYATSSSNAYMAVFAPSNLAKIRFPQAYTPKSIDIANDNFIYLASKFGYMTTDSVTVSPATYGDYYRVNVEALGPNGMTTGASTSIDLINCNYDNPAKYIRSTTWNTLDLTDLGQVNGLLLSIETSLDAFPHLFCIDNLRLQD